MSYIETLINEKIKKIDATIDTCGCDRRMLQLACKDFVNYMKFSNKSIYTVDFEQKLNDFSEKQRLELDFFLSIWTTMWMNKWKQRVKLLIGNEKKKETNESTQIINTAEPIWQTLECKQELIDIVKTTLINNGEICVTELLAENVLKKELSKNKPNLKDKQQAVAFLENLMHGVHQITKTTGPIMFVEVNKTYYNSVTT